MNINAKKLKNVFLFSMGGQVVGWVMGIWMAEDSNKSASAPSIKFGSETDA